MHPRFHAERKPSRPAAIMAHTGEVLTYGELEQKANQGAHLLRALGVRNGDTIAIWLPNILAYYTVYWAAQRAGVFITPVSTALTEDEAGYILADSGSKLLVTSARLKSVDAFMARHQELAPSLQFIFSIDASIKGALDWDEAIASRPTTPIPDEQAGYHMVYSSGTTGRPKGVRIPLSGGAATEPHFLADNQQRRYGVGEQTVYLSPAPLYHTAPLAGTTATQRLGGTIILMPKFDALATLQAIEKYRVSFTQMVPTMFIRLLRLPDDQRLAHDLSSLTHVIHAAAPCPVDIKRQMIEWVGPILYEYYGGSEGNGSTFITSQEWLRKPGSVGRADWGTLHVCSDTGDELPRGQQGNIYFEGGWDFRYLNDDKKSQEARNPLHPSWTTLGDIGVLDEDGYLFLTDRKSFMIISGGVNIYPQETENLLASHPKIRDVAVIGVPNAEMGEEVKAVVEPLNWSDANDEFAHELVAYCRAHLSHIKCPRSVDFIKQLPRHETGKLYKRLIRDQYWANK